MIRAAHILNHWSCKMNKMITVVGALLLSTSLIGSAVASEAYYGQPKQKLANTKAAASNSQVVLHNYTYGEYTAYATYQPTGKQEQPFYVGPEGSGMDVITYDINYPDHEVCLDVVMHNVGPDHHDESVYDDCLSYGNANIGPYMTANKPAVKVVK